MEDLPQGEITSLLSQVRNGRADAIERLLELIYPSLRGMAAKLLQGERDGNSYQATELVHETFLRVFAGHDVPMQNRAHMMAVAAKKMRNILVDHARARLAEKRGKGETPAEIKEEVSPATDDLESLLVLDDLLDQLREVDRRAAEIVELRFFAGLSREEISERLGVHVRTVQRDWEFARAWFLDALKRV